MKNVFYFFTAIAVLLACDKDDSVTPSISISDQQSQATELLASYAVSDTSKAMAYVDRNAFIQHNLDIEDGLAGMIEAIQIGLLKGAKVSPSRIFEDGNFLVVHGTHEMSNGTYAGFNVFRFKGDKIVEHWDNLQILPPPNTAGRTMLDGPTEISDLDATEANKQLVTDFIETIMINGEQELIRSYFDGNQYVQHSPTLNDSVSSFEAQLEEYATQGIEYRYQKLHMVVGSGHFVLSMSEGIIDEENTAFYDLFRVSNGKIAEHWDVVTKIPPESQWQNNNGKF